MHTIAPSTFCRWSERSSLAPSVLYCECVLAKRCGSQSLCQTLQNHDHPWPIDNSGESWWVIRGDGHFPNLALGARTSRPRMRLRPCCERERCCSRNVLSCVYHILSKLSSWIKLHTWWSGLYIDLVINYFFAPLSATPWQATDLFIN